MDPKWLLYHCAALESTTFCILVLCKTLTTFFAEKNKRNKENPPKQTKSTISKANDNQKTIEKKKDEEEEAVKEKENFFKEGHTVSRKSFEIKNKILVIHV